MRASSTLVLACLLAVTPTVRGADAEELPVTNENDAIVSLEREWLANHNKSYFQKALKLFRDRNARPKITTEFFASQLDIASGVVLRSFAGIEFGEDAGAVRVCQAEIIKQLVAVDVPKLKELPGWQELRIRYGRLLMLQRATWVSLRDPELDGKPIELDSTVRLQPDIAAAQERILRNQRIALQRDLKSFLEEIKPAIDRFMVAAFSDGPQDLRVLEALLATGGYTPEERTVLTASVKKAFGQR